MNYYSYMNSANARTVAEDSSSESDANLQTSPKSTKETTLEEHDLRFHPNGWKPGDRCKLREGLESYGDKDDLTEALSSSFGKDPYYLTRAHSSARLVKPMLPTTRGYNDEIVLRADLPEGTRPEDELEAVYGLAEQNIGTLNTITEATARDSGATASYRPQNNAYKGLPIKTWTRAKQKADTWFRKDDGRLGDYSQLNDLIGTTLIIPDDGSFPDVLEHLDSNVRKFGAEIVRVKPYNMTSREPGYRDVKVSIKYPNGGLSEVILIEDFMKKQKYDRNGHAAYEAQRVLDGIASGGDSSVSGLLDDVEAMMDMLYERNAGKIDDSQFEARKKSVGDAIKTILANPNGFMVRMPEGFRNDIQDQSLHQRFFDQERNNSWAAINKVMKPDDGQGGTSRWDRMVLCPKEERLDVPGAKQGIPNG